LKISKLILETPCDASFAAVWVCFYQDFVADEYLDPVQAHFACQVSQNKIAALELYPKERVWERLLNYPLYFINRIH
jgi:hypothetical protein